MGYIGNPLDPWGAADPATAYAAAFESMAASGAYDVLVLVHDFPYRSAPSEVATANDVTYQLLAATRARPEILPVYVSLTSGEPPPETKAVLDGDGGGAPILRGAVEAFRAIAERGALGAAARAAPGERPVAAGLAGARRRPDVVRGRPERSRAARAGRATCHAATTRSPSARASSCCARAGIAVIEAIAAPDAAAAVAAAERLGRPVALKLDVPGLAHKSDLGGRRPRAGRRRRGPRRRRPACSSPAAGAGWPSAACSSSRWRRRGSSSSSGMRRDPLFGPVVVVGLGGILTEILDDVAIRLAPIDAAEAGGDARRAARRPAARRGPRPARRRPVGGRRDARGARPPRRSSRPDLVEIDLNPVIASAGGAVAVDALVVLEGRGRCLTSRSCSGRSRRGASA